MALDWKQQAIEQLEFHWNMALRPRLEGLTDEEYLWEPAVGCWSVRPRGEAVTAMAMGQGDLVVDWDRPEPDPAPVTTIAWRIAHVACGVFGMRAANHFGEGGMDYDTVEWSGTAAGGVAFLDEQHARWIDGVRSLDDAGMAAPVGPTEGPWADAPMAGLVLHINREAIHHGAEIALLRDLYRTSTAEPA